jgi:threonine aldolase
MANQLALRLLGRAGTDVLCGARAHVYRYEHAAAAGNARVQLRPLDDESGVLRADDVATAIEAQHHHLPEVSAIAIENTHMPASGRPWRRDELDALLAAARAGALAVHCDGARIWNASIALGVAPRDLAAGADTVMFCLSKGLAAPGPSELGPIRDANAGSRSEPSRLGGGMSQAGVIAAAGVVALETMVERLRDDHERARTVAELHADRVPGSVDPVVVETNLVCARASALPPSMLDDLAAHGVRAGTIDPATVRFVTHKDVDDAGIDRFRVAIDSVAGAATF